MTTQQSGLWHDYWLINVWGFSVAIVSIGLIIIGVTGVYIWFKLYNERIVGAVLLTLSLGYSLTLIALLHSAW